MQRFLRDRFEIDRVIRRLNPTTTFVGHDRWTGMREVFVKCMASGTFKVSSRTEPRLAALRGLRHPLLVNVENAGFTPKGDFYTIRPYMESTPSPNRVSDSEIDQIIEACAVLQSEHLVHGGIKPSNVFSRDGLIQLVDAGLPARSEGATEPKSLTFIAPEVLSGSKLSTESDLYSLGALLYRIYSDRDVFEDLSAERLRDKCANACPMPLEEAAQVGREISDTIMGLIGQVPDGRKRAFSDLLRLRNVRSRPATRSILVGRAASLNDASEILNESHTNTHITAIGGDPGAGKSRLVDEMVFHSEFQGHLLVVGHSYERENRRFEPVLQVLDQWFNQDSQSQKWLETSGHDFRPSLTKVLPDLTESDLGSDDSEPTSEQLTVDLVGTLLALARIRSACSIVLEDLHWADDGTLQVVKQVALRSGESGLNIILTFRTRQLPRAVHDILNDLRRGRAVFKQVSLEPLDETQSLHMARTLSSDAPAQTWIVENSGGNPLLVEECARYREAGPEHPPSRIQDVLIETVKRLPAEIRTAAEVLSLFPKPIPMELANDTFRTVADGFPSRIVDELKSAGISIARDDQIAFRHDRIRRSIYRNIPLVRRRKLHAMVYGIISKVTRDSEPAAFHAKNGGLLDTAVSAYEGAGHRRRQEGDYRFAADLFAEARKLYRRLGKSVPMDLIDSYAQSLAQAGQTRRARRTLEDALDELPDGSRVNATIYLTLGACSLEQPEKAANYFELATELAPEGSRDGPRSLLRLAQAYALSGRISEAESTLEKFEHLPLDASQTDFEWYEDLKALVLIALHRFAEALSIMESSNPKSAFLPHVLVNRSVCLDRLGRLNEAVACQQMALDLSRKRGLLFGELVCLQNQAETETKRGNFEDARNLFLSADRLTDTMRTNREGERTSVPVMAVDHANLQLEMGNYAAALKLIAFGSREMKGPRGSWSGVIVALGAAEVFGRIGQSQRALKAAQEVSTSELLQSDFLKVRKAIALADTDTGPVREQLRTLTAALELTASLGTLYQRARILIALTVLHIENEEPSKADKTLLEAAVLTKRCGLGAMRPRVALLRGKLVQGNKNKLRYLIAALQMAKRLPLPEVEAEAGFLIAKIKFSDGAAADSSSHLRESVQTSLNLAGQIPTRARKRYLNFPWRQEAREMLRQLDEQMGSEDTVSAVDRIKSEAYFKAVYELTVALGRVAGVHEFSGVLRNSLSNILNRGFIIYLTTRDKEELYESQINVDSAVSRRVSKLYKRFSSHPFFGDHELRPNTTSGADHIAWIPLICRQAQFGGLYIDLSDRPLLESELEFLTAAGIIASNTLATILWSVQAKPKPQVTKPRYEGIIGSSSEIEEVCNLIKIASGSDATVLIEGESGTGKELVAKAIHQGGARSDGPLITVDCGAIPETLIESELFGSRKGSFTGATADRAGLVEAANGGTLFLDEISNTSPSLQVKLLRVLQEREVRRIGDTRGRPVDIRLVAATNADLEERVQKGAFRQDLLYRLKVLHVVVPPLRHRRKDIPDIARSVLDRLNSTHKTRKRFDPSAIDQLIAGNYSGNVRELQNVVERAYFMTTDSATIKETHVDPAESSLGDRNEVLTWFEDLTGGRKDFWSTVHRRYKKRDISREKVIALMDLGLRATRGSYKSVASLFHIKESEHRKFVDFLRRNHCQPDFRPYRKLPESSAPQALP